MSSEYIPVTFTFKGKEYKGHFSNPMGAGSNAKFHLMANRLYWGRLRLREFDGKWYFDPTPKTEELKELVNEFADLIMNLRI